MKNILYIGSGKSDVYNTGRPRTRFYYPEFGVNKWILLGMNGDFTGKVEPN